MSERGEDFTTIWDRIRGAMKSLEEKTERRLVNAEEIAEKLSRRARVFRERVHQPVDASPKIPVLFFSTHRAKYALPLESVVQIQSLDSFSPVPGAPRFIHGVVQFRGQILALLDLARLFGSLDTGIADTHFQIVADAAGRRVVIAAGDVEDLVAIPQDSIKSAAHLTQGSPAHWFQGVYDSDRLVLQPGAILSDDIMKDWRSTRAGADETVHSG